MKDGIGRGRGFFFLKEFSAHRPSAFVTRCLLRGRKIAGVR